MSALARCIAFVATAVALAGCCVSSSGCYAPVPGVPTAWDGQGVRPGEGGEPRRQSAARTVRPNTEMIIGPITDAQGQVRSASDKPSPDKPKSEKQLTQDDAADRDADEKLTKRLMICRDCLPPARD
jgi:hypothetical protein